MHEIIWREIDFLYLYIFVCCIVFKAMKSLGQDPQIGSKLSTLLAEADFEIKDFQERFLCYGKTEYKKKKKGDTLLKKNSFA